MNKLCENILKYAYLITFYGIISATSEVYIDTKLGRLKGVQKLSRDGKEFNAFLNIPFAQPPVGVLRFQVSCSSSHTSIYNSITCLANYNDAYLGPVTCTPLEWYLGRDSVPSLLSPNYRRF